MKMVRCLLVGIGVIVLTAVWCMSNMPSEVRYVPVQDVNYVQSIPEAQERLKAQGYYDGKIDGKWGPETDRAYGNWCAKQYFKD